MTNIEAQRAILEDLDNLEQAITDRFDRNCELYPEYNKYDINFNYKKRSNKEMLLQQHEIAAFIRQYKKQKTQLDNLRKSPEFQAEIKQFSSINLASFNEMISKIKAKNDLSLYKDPANIYKMKSGKDTLLSEFQSNLKLSKIFNLNENLGKFLNLVEFHSIWINLIKQNIDMLRYLEVFDDFSNELNSGIARNNDYLNYLKSLSSYLIEFINRSKPLFEMDLLLLEIKHEYELSISNNAEEKENKEEKRENGIFCKPCDKLFTNESVYKNHLGGKKHLKNEKKMAGSTGSAGNSNNNNNISDSVKYQEFLISKLMTKTELNKIRKDTKLNIERKRLLTERERAIENEQLENIDEVYVNSDDEEKERERENAALSKKNSSDVFNPLNLPIGPDGQPIPFWLWKLHGLGIEFNCEICGNYTYKGRKAFSKHFFEQKHMHGLRCLGIPPSLKAFKDIVKIDDAVNLWNKIKNDWKKNEIEKENSVQVEDDEGNVMSEKVYNDLKKQGLI